MKNYSKTDKFIIKSNEMIDILFNIKGSGRDYPAKNVYEGKMSNSEKKLVTNLMRVNHSGEVAAQGLYIGHAISAKTLDQKKLMLNMASEEKDHLDWCDKRIKELKGNTSLFNPLWFIGSIGLGFLSGIKNDKKSLGFLEETEIQVTDHLDSYIKKLPENDHKTYAILQKMKSDEKNHSETAHNSGAEQIPLIIKKIMKITANIMKFSSFRL